MTTTINFNGLTDNLSIDEEHDFIYDSNIFNIYVLECEDKSSGGNASGSVYYIGKTNKDVSIRFNQHKSSDNTCAWTNKYKPIKIIETYKTKDQLDEDKITKKYMIKYGIYRVRGGSYTKIELDDWMIKSLEHEFTSAKDNCYNCNEKGHFAKECPLDKKLNIQKYLKDFTDITSIGREIDKLEIVYEQIIILNQQIIRTSIFDPNNKKEYEDKLEKNSEEFKLYFPTTISSTSGRVYQEVMILHKEKIESLQQEQRSILNKLQSIKDGFNDINNIYKQLFINDKIYLESQDNQTIKLYKLRAFNLEKKKELKELLNIHTSEDLIKMKLEGLYEKKISILSN
jgi:hypothetical protein